MALHIRYAYFGGLHIFLDLVQQTLKPTLCNVVISILIASSMFGECPYV